MLCQYLPKVNFSQFLQGVTNWEVFHLRTGRRRPFPLFSTKPSPTFRSLSSLSSEGSGNEFKTEKALFKLYMNPATEKINMGHFLLALEKTGLRRSDPRLQELIDALEELHSKIGEEGTTPENIDLPFESFQRLIEQNLVLISQAFSHKLIIPDFLDFCTHVKDIYRRCKNNKKVF